MKKTLVFISFFMLLAAVFTACNSHQNPSAITTGGTISGIARQGHPAPCTGLVIIPVPPQPTATPTTVPVLAGATIQLFNSTNTEIASTVTAPDGSYKFGNLGPGQYTVKCLYTGYDWASICCLTVVDPLVTTAPDLTIIYANPPGVLEVQFGPAVTYSAAVAILANYGCTDDAYIAGSMYEPSHWLIVYFPGDKTIAEMRSILSADPGVTATSPTYYYCAQ
jgi:hypothetical protein